MRLSIKQWWLPIRLSVSWLMWETVRREVHVFNFTFSIKAALFIKLHHETYIDKQVAYLKLMPLLTNNANYELYHDTWALWYPT